MQLLDWIQFDNKLAKNLTYSYLSDNPNAIHLP